jgi:hypothetical protein
VVGEGEGWHVEGLRARDEIAESRQPVEQAVFAVGVQMNEVPGDGPAPRVAARGSAAAFVSLAGDWNGFSTIRTTMILTNATSGAYRRSIARPARNGRSRSVTVSSAAAMPVATTAKIPGAIIKFSSRPLASAIAFRIRMSVARRAADSATARPRTPLTSHIALATWSSLTRPRSVTAAIVWSR